MMRIRDEVGYLKELIAIRDQEINLLKEKERYMMEDHRYEIGKIAAEKKRAEAHIIELKKAMNLQ